MGERCQHHPNTPAQAPCAGCKHPVCATCLSEGRHGFCQPCVDQALGLGAQAPNAAVSPRATVVMQPPARRGTGALPPLPDAKPQGPPATPPNAAPTRGPVAPSPDGPSRVAGTPAPPPGGPKRPAAEASTAPEVPAGPKRAPKSPEGEDPTLGKGYGGVAPPPGKRGPKAVAPDEQPPIREHAPRDPNMCFLHRDIRASAKCLTCNRAYCPVCLNTAGICGHCTTHKAEAQAILFSPNARGQAVLDELAEQEAKKRLKPRDAVLIGAAGLGLILAWKWLHQPAPKVDPTTAIFQKLRANDLSEAEKAQLAALHGQRRVDIATPPPTPVPVVQPMVGGGFAGGQAPAGLVGRPARQALAAAGGGARPGALSRAVRVGLLAPSTARGVVSVGASVSGQPGRVDFLVDGAFVDSRSAPPYRFSWASQAHGNGPHTLTVEARGEAGLLSRSSRRVVVAN